VLAVSHVSFYTGQCLNLEKLQTGARKRDALFAVDATHSAGALRVDAGLTDLTVSSSYKWLLAAHGTAPCYLSPAAEAQVTPSAFGWRNLQVWPPQTAERHPAVDEKPMPERMEPGNPAMPTVMLLDRSLETILEIGIDRIQAHVRALAGQVDAGLRQLGFEVISPTTEAARSGNTCFLTEDAEGLTARLRDQGVLVWGEFGRIRVSTHLYNGSGDVERFLVALRAVM
jgi:selenocysteine lyase/cysteine desulfurase